MIVVHYILGFPPHRSGGLTTYSNELIQAERELGHTVYVLYPGNHSLTSKISSFRKESEYVYELANALPVPLLYGTGDPSIFMDKRNIVGYEDFIATLKPDVFHIHTLMGLPKELMKKFKESGIRIVYTSHDYFGLCPKVNFIDKKGEVCDGAEARKCMECCTGAPGKLFLKIRNSKYIVPIKKLLK